MEQEWSTDICVLGGGPAGSTISKRLSELGHQVLLLEKEEFPRPHVGICLSNPTDSLLDYLGIGVKIKQEAFATRKCTLVKWGTGKAIATAQAGSHLDRGRFDQILLQSAVNAGVQLLQPVRCYAVFHKEQGEWSIRGIYKGKKIRIAARFLVDASGRSNSILAGKRIRYAPPLFALHAYWQLGNTPRFDGFMEAGNDAWLWAARLNNRQAMITLLTDPTQLSLNGKPKLKEFYLSSLENFSLTSILNREKLISLVKGCDAGSRYSVAPVGADFIRVGDANFTVDPMASQGVHLALSTAIQAAIVVNTLIRYLEHRKAAQDFYLNRQKERVRQFKEQTAAEYAKAAEGLLSSFWLDRAQGSIFENKTFNKNIAPLTNAQKIRVCPKVKIINTPVMKDQWVELTPALHHPALRRPIAFLGGKNLAFLFPYLKKEQNIAKILDSWRGLVPEYLGGRIIQWLWDRQILLPVSSSIN